MNSIREINKNSASRFLIPLLAVLFVFSVSAHNHKIGVSPASSAHVSGSVPSANHSVEDCPACLLHGNIKLPSADTVVNVIDVRLYIAYIEFEDLIPLSFSAFDKPSRAPPAV